MSVQQTEKIKFTLKAISITIIAVLLLSSCSLTRHVKEGEYLLERNIVKLDNKTVNHKELQNTIRQKSNKRILLISRPYLWIYNLSNPAKTNKFHSKLRELGEPPVILDENQIEKSKNQFSIYLKNKGYYQSIINDTVIYRTKRAKVKYTIETGKPYIINKIDYQFVNKQLLEFVLNDSSSRIVKPGMRFDLDVLQNYRLQIERLLRNNGYFDFSKEMIEYEADTAIGQNKVNLIIALKPLLLKDSTTFEYKKTIIQSINVISDYDIFIQKKDSALKIDTVVFDKINYIYPNGIIIKSSILNNNIYIIPQSIYKFSNEEVTYKNLASLNLFKFINIQFTKSNRTDSAGFQFIDCNIELANNVFQGIETSLDLTSSTGIGVSGSIAYNHRNLFSGAESFNIRLKGSNEAIKKTNETIFDQTIEIGVESSLQMHRFLLPINFNRFILKYNPKTAINTSYIFKQRPEYAHSIANASLGYLWKGNSYNQYRFNPLDLNYVDLLQITDHFNNLLSNYQRSSFEDHILAGGNFMYEYNDQLVKKNKPFTFFRFNSEFYGNLLNTIYKVGKIKPADNNTFQLFNISFAQFLRNDFEFRYNQPLNELDRLAFRFYIGWVVPYGNSTSIPFERQFFGGGPNSMRAWQYRNIGPGSYHDTTAASFANRTADFKLEWNIEYRFKLFLSFEGALFTDIGNIWATNKYDLRENAQFRINRFYKELGIGSGFGLRYDFNFAIIRTDLAIKIFNPGNLEGNRLISQKKLTWSDDMNLSFGIGFPF